MRKAAGWARIGGGRPGASARCAASRAGRCRARSSISPTAAPRTRGPCAATRRPSATSSSCRGPSTAPPSATCPSTLFGKRLSMPVLIGPTGLVRPVLAERRMRRRRAPPPRRASAFASATGRSAPSRPLPRSARAALDAGLRLSRPRLYARARPPGQGGRLRRPGPDHRQPAPRQPRARPSQRLQHPAALPCRSTSPQWRPKAALAPAHAHGDARHHLRQLCPARRGVRSRQPRRPHGLPARSRRCRGTTSTMLRRHWNGPLVLKGILHPAEARQAVLHGVDGLIVSNHGGRQLDGAPAPIDALPDVLEAVGGSHPGARRRRHPPRLRRRQGARARRPRLPRSPARSSGASRSPARRASPTCSRSSAARSTASWA